MNETKSPAGWKSNSRIQTSLTLDTEKDWPISGGTELATVKRSGSPVTPPRPASPALVSILVALPELNTRPLSIESFKPKEWILPLRDEINGI